MAQTNGGCTSSSQTQATFPLLSSDTQPLTARKRQGTALDTIPTRHGLKTQQLPQRDRVAFTVIHRKTWCVVDPSGLTVLLVKPRSPVPGDVLCTVQRPAFPCRAQHSLPRGLSATVCTHGQSSICWSGHPNCGTQHRRPECKIPAPGRVLSRLFPWCRHQDFFFFFPALSTDLIFALPPRSLDATPTLSPDNPGDARGPPEARGPPSRISAPPTPCLSHARGGFGHAVPWGAPLSSPLR